MPTYFKIVKGKMRSYHKAYSPIIMKKYAQLKPKIAKIPKNVEYYFDMQERQLRKRYI